MASHPWVLSFLSLRGEGQMLKCSISVSCFAGDSALLLNSCRNVVGNKLVALVVRLAAGIQILGPVLKNRTLDVEFDVRDVVSGFNKAC